MMDDKALVDELFGEFQAATGKTFTQQQIDQMEPIMTALAKAITKHIRLNAEVTVNVASGIAVQVNTGTGTGTTIGTGAGTGVIDGGAI